MNYDVAVVGAGIAGLTCARQLQQQSYRVIVLEKSRGVGGRVTTRRVGDRLTIDRGLPWLEVQGKHTHRLIQQLQRESIVRLWHCRSCQLDRQGIEPIATKHCYVAPEGINAVAKYLAKDLKIVKQCRVTAVESNSDNTWNLVAENSSWQAKAIVLAVPAPQAVAILAKTFDLSAELINQLQAVNYFPCLTVSAGYDAKYHGSLPEWDVLNLHGDEWLAKIIFDSSKKNLASQPVVILHSTPQLANQYLETTDLSPVGKQLLERAALLLHPWFKFPQWIQVHRWRYAIPSQHLAAKCLTTNSFLPLVCGGDWCNGNNLESALDSGSACAKAIVNLIESNS